MGELSLHDVAKAAGVHSSTVSRALSRPEAVNVKTRERILRIAEELGYRVNPLGQALRRKASNLVPLIVPDITNPFYGELAKAIAAVAGPRGYQLVLCVTEGVPGQTSAYLASMDALFSPFAIVAPSTKLDVDALGQAALAKRLIVIDRVPPELDVPTVFIDNRLGVRLSFEHLLELGHREIAYLTGTVGTYSGQERLDEFRILATAHGLAPSVINGGYGPEAGRAAAEQFLALPSRPTAVIASNDMAAFGFMSQVSERGVRIPEDLSVTGFDGVAIGATFNPSITTVAQPLAELGRRAIEVAERFVSTGVIEHELLVPELLIRRSTRRLK
ncbi:LacI family DNA-binding transcriptional regulator [Agromyces silvae]|uniref:LacI family DNA-binding transcriptional regulator n=1 Tax=Agromyces silvae TaxID=3388266 RepID=UPI00280B2017|nr:LacI family DNA-binding transcriptional regulator [Agromyces protaetiae]